MNRNAVFGLEIPVTLIGTGVEKAVAWIQRRKTEEMRETEKQMMKMKIAAVLLLSAN